MVGDGVGALPVELANPDQASGLADMLHQFLQQTVDESADKSRAAQRLSGTLWFQSSEDMSLVVALSFDRNRIGVADAPASQLARPSLTADFLSTAHITTGEESPFDLLRQKKIHANFRLTQALFLWRVLRFMRIEDAEDVARDARGARDAEEEHTSRDRFARKSRAALLLSLALMIAIAIVFAAFWFARR
jgi:hypothetical protein